MIPPPSGTNHLITYLRTMIPSTAIERIITDYHLASTPDQAIIFLQLDTAGQCRAGKIMHYNPSTGKCIKDETIPGRINWLRRTADFPHLDLKVSDLLEKHATPEARAAHIDLADWLIQYLEDKNA